MPDVLEYPCPKCGEKFELSDEYRAMYGGQLTACSSCGSAFTVPGGNELTPDAVDEVLFAPTSPDTIGAALPTTEEIPFASVPMAHAVHSSFQPPVRPAAYPPAQPATQPPPLPVQQLGYVGTMNASYQATTGPLVWTEGNLLVTHKDVTLPGCCIKCGQVAEGAPIRRSLYWHSPYIYWSLLGGVLIYAIVALCTRQNGTIYLSLCREHRSARIRDIWIAWGIVLASIASFFVAGIFETYWLIPLGIIALIGAAIWGMLRAQVVSPKRIDERLIWLKGVGHAYLRQVPAQSYQAGGFPVAMPAQSYQP